MGCRLWGRTELDTTEVTAAAAADLLLWGFPGGTSGKEPTFQCKRHKRCGFSPWVGKIPLKRAWQPIPVFLPGESYGQGSLVGYSPLDHKELDTTEAT